MIPELQTECLEFRKKIWLIQLQIQGKEPFPESGRIRIKWLQIHRGECEDCQDWLSRVMSPYWAYLFRMFDESMKAFGREHDLSKAEIATRLRLWHDMRIGLRKLHCGKKFEKFMRKFMRMAQVPLKDFRELLVDWLQKNDPQ